MKSIDILRNDKNIHFYIVGDGLLFEKYKKFKKKNNLHNVFFLGRVDKKFIPSLLSNSDLNLLLGKKLDLNQFGLSPNKLFDYFASGKPIISNRRTNYDLVTDNYAGITIDDEDPVALSEGIKTLFNVYKNEKGKYNDYCRASRKASEEFQFCKNVRKIIEIFERFEEYGN